MSSDLLTGKFPIVCKTFESAFSGVSLEDFSCEINRVNPSLIRVDAEEVSYGLHIILRFELEQALISQQLQVTDLKDAWNELYKKYLGIAPPDDLQGVLQDVQWYSGAIGYFPTYLLGAMYAAQIFERMKSDLPNMMAEIEKGEFRSTLAWLQKNIHQYGKRFSSVDLIERATGSRPKTEPLINHLSRKVNAY